MTATSGSSVWLGEGVARVGRAFRLPAGGRSRARRDSPYPALDDPILDEQKGYVYPPQLLLVLLPLTPLPAGVAAALVESE